MDSKKTPLILVLTAVGIAQILVVPVFSNMALGGKVAFIAIFTACWALYFLFTHRVLLISKLFLPFIALIVIFFVSLLNAVHPEIGYVELGSFITSLLFAVLLSNLPLEADSIHRGIFFLLRVLGVLVAFLCLYQYFNWLNSGSNTEMLIPYLLPPSGARVGGVYGQPNLTALLLVLSQIAWLSEYILNKEKPALLLSILQGSAFFVVCCAFFLTGSRSGYLSLAFTAICLLVIIRHELRFWVPKLWIPSLLLALAFICVQIPHVSSTGQVSGVAHAGVSVDARFLFWTVAGLQFMDHPLLGIGLDHFKLFLPSYSMQAHDILGFVEYEAMGYTKWTHNEYLQILAETGVAGAFFLCFFFFQFVRRSFNDIKHKGLESSQTILYVLTLPFFVQGMFTWPFRHPGLLIIFFMILGGLFSSGPCCLLRFNRVVSVFSVVLISTFLLLTGYLSYKEYSFLQVKTEVKKVGCSDSVLDYFLEDSYYRFDLLRSVLPICLTGDDNLLSDHESLLKFRPYYREIAELQGTYGQWYNLGLINWKLEDYDQARIAFEMSVNRQPVNEKGWAAIHRLNIEEASRHTGRPISDFLPPETVGSTDFYDSLFRRL